MNNKNKKEKLFIKKYSFFRPTPIHKKFMILDIIEKNKNITQREIASIIGVAVSMVNKYLNLYEKDGLIKRRKFSSRVVEYVITEKGVIRKKVLNTAYFKSAQNLYNSAKENIEFFLNNIEHQGFKQIFLYGAGEVCEILLSAINKSNNSNLKIIAIIDDDPNKIGNSLEKIKIVSNDIIFNFKHDGILISSYTNNERILKKLLKIGYQKNKIIQFF